MARSTETGRVMFTCTLPLKHGVKVYEFAEKMDVGANKILQQLVSYAVERAQCKKVGRNCIELVFDNEVKEDK